MASRSFLACALIAVAMGGCNTMTVQENTLSTKQKIAMISTPGDGVSPPTNVVLLQNRHGQYVPISTGFSQAPVPALLTGAAAGVAVGTGLYAAAKAAKPTNVIATGGAGGVSSSNGGGSAFANGGSSSATGFGGTAFGGSATSINTNTNSVSNF